MNDQRAWRHVRAVPLAHLRACVTFASGAFAQAGQRVDQRLVTDPSGAIVPEPMLSLRARRRA